MINSDYGKTTENLKDLSTPTHITNKIFDKIYAAIHELLSSKGLFQMMLFTRLLIFLKTQTHTNDKDSKRLSQKEEILTGKKVLKRFSLKEEILTDNHE